MFAIRIQPRCCSRSSSAPRRCRKLRASRRRRDNGIARAVPRPRQAARDRTPCRLAYPAAADMAHHRVSVLTPIGAALIGVPCGAAIGWPNRRALRGLEIVAVIQPAAQERAASWLRLAALSRAPDRQDQERDPGAVPLRGVAWPNARRHVRRRCSRGTPRRPYALRKQLRDERPFRNLPTLMIVAPKTERKGLSCFGPSLSFS